jgi:myo-inositol 2-dehydrogenase/D-chiro-inositol 1-dehydrogenase
MSLGIGVIGTGAIGADHARRVTEALTGANVVALNDVNLAQAEAVREKLNLNAKIYENGHELIQAEDVDAILVCSWGPTHEEFVVSAVQAGKYVFCEKPLATTAEGCRNIVEAEIASGKRLVQVGFMRPFDAGYQMLKEAIDKGKIGHPLMIHAVHRNPTVADRYTTDMAIHDTLIHELDVFRWLLDDDYISAQVIFPRQTPHAHEGLRDPQVVLLETRKGVRIDVEVFVNCRYGYDIQCSVVGEEGIANLPDPMSLTVRKDALLQNEILTHWKDRFIESYDVELQAFINGCLTEKMTGASSWDGMAAAIAADVCVKAQSSGQIEAISMPERPNFYG